MRDQCVDLDDDPAAKAALHRSWSSEVTEVSGVDAVGASGLMGTR